MAKVEALIEVEVELDRALTRFAAASASFEESRAQIATLLPDVAGIELRPTAKAVPMFTPVAETEPRAFAALSAFASPDPSPDVTSATEVIPATVEEEVLEELAARDGVTVWPNSPIQFFRPDCGPDWEPAVTIEVIQERLGAEMVWQQSGRRGDDVIVGVIDQGIDGTVYPVVGGFNRPGGQVPGEGAITSHGSMCAADVLVAAPNAKLYDYPFLTELSSSALAMFNAALDQRRQDGTPHILSNSWGFVAIPPREQDPGNEVWNIDHPLHRKIREVIASGAPVVFAAGNCGVPCPSRKCHPSSIGQGRSIHGANALREVITVAAVNHRGERIGYSSQGPGFQFEHDKPDLAGYSHFFGNMGPGRPAGGDESSFDNGTSAACPIVSGVLALLLSAMPAATPAALRAALIDGAGGQTWDPDVGRGIVDAAAAYSQLTGAQAA